MGDRPLCKYFASNCCAKGEHCSFSHDRSARADLVCRFYLAGHCEYGSRCRYDHVRPKATTVKPTASTSSPTAVRPSFGTATSSSSLQQPQAARLPSLKSEQERARYENIAPAQQQPVTTAASEKGEKPAGKPKNAWAKPLVFSVDAPIFVPTTQAAANDYSQVQLCPYFEMRGDCINGADCQLVHGDLCEMCGQFLLHPYNEEQRKLHHRECLSSHEEAMNAAFVTQISAQMHCGICMDKVLDVGRFGILQNCKHCFCLKCIREWRKNKGELEKKVVRSCPECRVVSDFIIPSSVWVDDQAEKDSIISRYQQNMSQKVCKYMNNGVPEDCPFGNKCFYKHQLPDGTIAEGREPHELKKRSNRRMNLREAFEIFSPELLHDASALMEDLYIDAEDLDFDL